jgi:hypothetical protein
MQSRKSSASDGGRNCGTKNRRLFLEEEKKMPGSRGKDVWVVPKGRGEWAVQVEGEERYLHLVSTQAEAIELAGPIAKRKGGQVVIQTSKGQDEKIKL